MNKNNNKSSKFILKNNDNVKYRSMSRGNRFTGISFSANREFKNGIPTIPKTVGDKINYKHKIRTEI